MTTAVKAPPPAPDNIVTRATEDTSRINIDICVEKVPDPENPYKKTLGRSFIKLEGPHTKGTYVTDETIQIKLPDESIVRTLNLVYGEGGLPNLPDKDREGVFSLLKGQKQHQVRAYPIESTERSHALHDIKAGKFDFIATANDQLPSIGYSKVSQSLTNSQNAGTSWGDFHLLRTWRTGEFVTFNQRTGYIYKLTDSRGGNLGANPAEEFRFDPSDKKWQFSFDGSVNYYKKYLIQDEVEQHEETRALTPKFNKFDLPIRAKQIKKQKHHGLERDLSYVSETQTNSRREFPPLRRSLPERDQRAKLTRSNILRHDFSQRRKLFFKLKGLPTPDTFCTMDYGKGKLFDADDALNEQNLKCPVCKMFYDTRDRAPHIMHCLHSCCDACLKTRVRAEMVQCPECAEVHEVPNNAIELLPVDNARQHLVKYFKVKHKTHELGCDSCDARNRATHRCRECDEFLCAVCTEAHKRTKVTKGHNIVPVDNLRKSVLEEFHHKRTCTIPEHDDQHFSFYCYSKGCDMPICSLCAVTDHNKADGHDIRNINDVYIENKRLVESLMIDVKHKKNMADEAVQGIEEEIQNLYLKESATDEDIDQAFLACQKQLEKRKNELKEKLSATSKAKKKGMESQLDKLISEKNSLEHASKFAQNVLGYSTPTAPSPTPHSVYPTLLPRLHNTHTAPYPAYTSPSLPHTPTPSTPHTCRTFPYTHPVYTAHLPHLHLHPTPSTPRPYPSTQHTYRTFPYTPPSLPHGPHPYPVYTTHLSHIPLHLPCLPHTPTPSTTHTCRTFPYTPPRLPHTPTPSISHTCRTFPYTPPRLPHTPPRLTPYLTPSNPPRLPPPRLPPPIPSTPTPHPVYTHTPPRLPPHASPSTPHRLSYTTRSTPTIPIYPYTLPRPPHTLITSTPAPTHTPSTTHPTPSTPHPPRLPTPHRVYPHIPARLPPQPTPSTPHPPRLPHTAYPTHPVYPHTPTPSATHPTPSTPHPYHVYPTPLPVYPISHSVYPTPHRFYTHPRLAPHPTPSTPHPYHVYPTPLPRLPTSHPVYHTPTTSTHTISRLSHTHPVYTHTPPRLPPHPHHVCPTPYPV